MTSPFSCSAASSGLPRLFHMSKPGSKWGPSSPGQELLCVSRRKFANLDLLRIRHFEKFDFRSDTHGTGLIHGKYQTGNRAIWLVDFLYQPSQELSRVISSVIIDSLSPFWVPTYKLALIVCMYSSLVVTVHGHSPLWPIISTRSRWVDPNSLLGGDSQMKRPGYSSGSFVLTPERHWKWRCSSFFNPLKGTKNTFCNQGFISSQKFTLLAPEPL